MDKELNYSDRRKYPRHEAMLLVDAFEVEFTTEKNKYPENCLTKNLSAGGVCLLLDKTLEKGDRINLKIKLAVVEKEIKAEGNVVWINQFTGADDKLFYEAGVMFMKIEESDREFIDAFVRETLRAKL